MNNDAVLFLHGLLGAPSMWEEVSTLLAGRVDLSIGCPWLPGHGSEPPPPGLGTFDEVVADLGERWLSGRTVLVGYSMGGRVALALAASFPERVRAVLAIGAHTGITSASERAERLAWERGLSADLAARGLPAFVEDWEKLPVFTTQRGLPAEVQERQRAERLGHRPEGIAWAIEALGTGSMPPLLDALGRGGVPVVFAVGALDRRAVAVARGAMGALPRAEVVVVPDAGHNLALEAPSVIADLVVEISSSRPRETERRTA